MAARQNTELPYGIGRTGPLFLGTVVVLLALIVLGLVAYVYQLREGLVVTGMRDVGGQGGATWGLYIAFDIYFVGLSFAGITVAAIIRLFDLEDLRPIARIAEALTVVALILGALTIVPDLGRPLTGLKNLFQYARPQSPFFATFSLVISGYLFASLVYLYLDGRRDASLLAKRAGRLQGFYRRWAAGYQDSEQDRERHQRATFWLALGIIPLLITAHSTLGVIFGIQGGTAGWFSALQAPSFVVLAAVSGVGHLIIIGWLVRKTLNLEAELPMRVFTWLGNVLFVLTASYVYLVVVEQLTAFYGGDAHEMAVAKSQLTGEYAWIFWGSVGLLVFSLISLLLQFALSRYLLPMIVLAGFAVSIAAIGKRFLIVVPPQTHGRLLPYDTGTYTPTWVEYSIIIGLMSLGALALLVFFKIFPVIHLKDSDVAS